MTADNLYLGNGARYGMEARKVLEVEHYELIRRKHEREGMSQREIARELGHSRKTVAKAAQ